MLRPAARWTHVATSAAVPPSTGIGDLRRHRRGRRSNPRRHHCRHRHRHCRRCCHCLGRRSSFLLPVVCIVFVSGRLVGHICGGVRPAAAPAPAPLLLPLPLLPLRLLRSGGCRDPSSPSVICCHHHHRCGGRGVMHGQCCGGPQRQGGWLGRE